MNLELIDSILSEKDSYVEKRFTKCKDTYLDKINNLTLAKSLCNESSYCNAIAIPHSQSPFLHSSHISYKLCKGKLEYSPSESIFAKGNLNFHCYPKRASKLLEIQ